MAVSRYALRHKTLNTNEIYKDLFKSRGVVGIHHYRSPTLVYPTQSQVARLHLAQHIWKVGDRYEKLAFRAFGDSRYWWVIAWINKRPGDFSNEIGDVIFIPINLEEALSVLET